MKPALALLLAPLFLHAAGPFAFRALDDKRLELTDAGKPVYRTRSQYALNDRTAEPTACQRRSSSRQHPVGFTLRLQPNIRSVTPVVT